MRLLTDRQKRVISQFITDHHLSLVAELCGKDAIPASDYERLRKSGMIKRLPDVPMDIVTAAHLLGAIVGDSKDASKLTPETFWEMARNSDLVTNIEHEAVELAKEKIATLIQSAGARVLHQFKLSAHAVDDSARKQKMLGVVAEGLAHKKSITQMANAMQKATNEASRSWMRDVHTEVHNLIEEGKAIALVKHAPNEDPFVYKLPHADACPYCKLLYLKPNGTPRVFRLSVLVSNGSNVGRKPGRPSLTGKGSTEYKATLGAMHPWCKCELHYLPRNTTFNSKGKLVIVKSEMEVIEDTTDGLEDLLNHDCSDHG